MPLQKSAFRHAPIQFRDEHGVNCLRVPLDRTFNQYAVVTASDYKRIQRAGATGAWFLNKDGKIGRAYIRTMIPIGPKSRALAMVARLVMEAEPRTVIRYVNGDCFDLRPWNLIIQKGKSKQADMRLVQRRHDAQPEFRA